MRIFLVVAGLGLMAAGGIAAGNDRNLYIVTHVDIAGGGSLLAEATNLIREFETDSRQDPGVARFEVLRQDGHPSHFTIFEVWQTRQAFDAHLAAAHTKHFREKLQPMLGSPYREGLHRLL
jgi:quinol monooxygenase YgiN